MRNLLLPLLSCACCVLTAAERPNIILFVVDDMGVMDSSQPMLVDENGVLERHPLNEFYRTPFLEKLAQQGVIFSQFYANSVCSPSRTSLLNGQNSARHHVTQWIDPFKKNAGPKGWKWEGFGAEDVMLPRILQKAGYKTIFCGKGHMGPDGSLGADPKNLGFDVNIAGCAIGRPASYYAEKSYGKGGKRAVPGLDKYHGTKIFLTEALTLEVNAAIDAVVTQKKPFFVQMSHYAVHDPFDSDPRFAANYQDSGKSRQLQAFATLIEGMDKSLGDMIEHLEKIGEAENTLIIFLGDNGSDAPTGNKYAVASSAPLRGKKGTHFEGGMRAPLVMAWAKPDPASEMQRAFPIKQGVVAEDFVTIEDIFPTALDAAEVEQPEGHVTDGYSLKPYLAYHSGKRPQQFLMHFPHPHNSSHYTVWRDGGWKLVYFYKKPKGKNIELYNLKQDPAEQTNLAQKQPRKVKTMLEKMRSALKKAGAQYPAGKGGVLLKPTI